MTSQINSQDLLTLEIFDELNELTDLNQSLQVIIEKIQKFTDIQAISIRLKDGSDFPYYVYNGFKKSFILQENSLCVKDSGGKILLEPSGDPLLECMCGNIIRKRTDPEKPFFTNHGSFVSNCTTELLATTTEDDRQSPTRNYCNSIGYESVALIPISVRGKTLGLLQLNDMRKDMFTAETVAYLELIGDILGAKIIKYTELYNEDTKFNDFTIRICINCQKVYNPEDSDWVNFEQYFNKIENIGEVIFKNINCSDCESITS